MKHLLKFCTLMLLCLGLGSCTVNQLIDDPVTAGKTGSFTAYLSSPTKTSHDGLKTYWQENDQIAIYSSETDAAPIVYSITHFNEDDSAVFQGPALDPDVQYTAMYPYVEGKTMKEAKDYILENQHQIGRIGSMNLKNTDILVASELSAATTAISFSHDIALVHIRTIASRVSGTDGVSVRGAWGDRVYYLKLSSIGSSSDYVDAYIAVPSTSEYFSNIYITYYKNGQAIPAKYTMPRSITISEGQILIMNMTIDSWPTQTATSLPKYDCDGVKAGHEYVEVGGVKWACANVGAMFPWEYGNYYAWGETSTKTAYTSNNYSHAGMDAAELQIAGVLDVSCGLTPDYDAAAVNWGAGWSLPSLDLADDMFYYHSAGIDCTLASLNDVSGLKVENEDNEVAMFLPLSGVAIGESISYRGSDGAYWTRHLNVLESDAAWAIAFSLQQAASTNLGDMYQGLPIRPVLSE